MDALPDRMGVLGTERPSRRLLTYYILSSVLWGPLLVVILPYRFARYRTLHYRFDREGVSMTWGALFRREIHLTYSRIQDIHLTSGILERYLGLARIQVETASGKAGAEMTIEGLENFEEVRDFLYSKMRGLTKASTDSRPEHAAAESERVAASADAELMEMLGELATTLRELRHHLEGTRGAQAGDTDDV